jgi:hypothetical protein
MVVHACNFSTRETEAGGPRVQGLCGTQRDPVIKKKKTLCDKGHPSTRTRKLGVMTNPFNSSTYEDHEFKAILG